MTHSYISGSALGRQLRRLGLTALLAGGTALAAQAQFDYTTTLTDNTAGTYTDLGANGTVISTNGNYDDANSAVQNIGFTFNYNGTGFTQFVLNTNGLIRLGANAPSSALAASPYAATPDAGPVNSNNPADVNLIMPFNFDLMAGTGTPEYRVYTTGTSPNRVCTIQWKNVADKAIAGSSSSTATVATQYANFSFQVKLYEGTANASLIEFVYGPATAGTGTEAPKFANVGLKGNDNTANNNITAVKPSVSTWSSTTFATGPQSASANAHNFRSSVTPDVGRTYRFFVPVSAANDASVESVLTLGKTPIAGLPYVTQAVVYNNGTSALTNVAVTLNVTGANTFTNTKTIPSIAVNGGYLISFDPLPASFVAGVNNVTVSVPADGNNSNNYTTVQQTILARNGTFSYVPSDQTTVTGQYVIGSPTTGGIFATKYTTNTAGTVTAVSVYLASAGASSTSAVTVGQTVYGVVLSPTGVVLGQSANYVVQTADIGTYKTFLITAQPPIAAGGSFLAGLAQPAYTGQRAYPLALQDEAPTRSNAYFSVPIGGGTPVDLSINTSTGANSGFGRFLMEATFATVTATSKELQRAVTVYPNPSETGLFNLDIHNANASGTLGVEVTNQLGQRVYTGTAHDNLTNPVNLSGLAPGLYHLQVRNGQEFTSTQISIVK